MIHKANKLKEQSRRSFDQQATDYDTASYGRIARLLYPYVLELLNELSYQSILDVGCGTGEILFRLQPRENLTLAGIDLSPSMIDIARQKLGMRADFQVADAEELPWSDNSFDVVLSVNAFHHYPQPREALAEVRRVAKPEGRFVLADLWAPALYRHFANLLFPFLGGGDVRLYSEKEVRTLLTEAGFKVVNWQVVKGAAYIATATLGSAIANSGNGHTAS